MEKILIFFSLKCSINLAEQSPPGFRWVKTILEWSKSPKIEFWCVFLWFPYTSLLKYAIFAKKTHKKTRSLPTLAYWAKIIFSHILVT